MAGQALLRPVLTATSFHRHFPRGGGEAESEKAALESTILTLQMKELQVRELWSSNKFIGDP